MLKFTSNVIFLIILATFFIVLFLNHQFNLSYSKEDFSGFSNGKTDYKSEPSLKTIVPDNNVYYDPTNANVIHMESNMAKVLTGTTNSYNVYDMTNQTDVEAINKLQPTISANRKTYCYEVVKNEQFLVYIPTSNNSFINIVNAKSNDYMNKNTKVVYAANTELNSIMTGTTDVLSLDNTNKLFSTSTNIIFIDGDNIKIIYVGNNEAKTFNKNDKTNISNFITRYNPGDVIDKIMNEGICTLYEIIPQQKYLFYLMRPKAFCLTVIDVNTSSNAIINPQSAKTILSKEPISPDKLKIMNPVLINSPGNAPSLAPTLAPALAPTLAPTLAPALAPSLAPTLAPALAPTLAPAPTQVKDLLPEKYNELDNFKSETDVLFQKKIPEVCPNLSEVLLNWYKNMNDNNKKFTPWGQIDGTGQGKDKKRFGNSAAAAADLIPILLPDKNKPSEFGRYEELLIENKDKDGSQTPNLKTPDITLLVSLDNLSKTIT
jgi:hypothetical protein